MTFKLLAVAVPLVFVAGCATGEAPFDSAAAIDHPANPDAAAAPAPHTFTTLSLTGAPARPASLASRPADGAYVCPMHPEVTSPTPGTCPKCKMKLEPRTANKPEATPRPPAGDHAGHDDGGH